MGKTNKTEKIAEQKYSKSALIASAEFIRTKDLLKVLLKDGELYTISETKRVINAYKNKEV